MATTTTTATPEYTPEHPPAYTRADDTPAYELDDVSRTSLHPSQIEACAPKPPPRQFKIFRYKPSKRVAIWVGVGLVCVCALVGTMIWYGVDRKRREASPARLGLAETIVRPQVGAPFLLLSISHKTVRPLPRQILLTLARLV